MSLYIGMDDAAKALWKIHLGMGDAAKSLQKIYLGVDDTAKSVYKVGTPVSSFGVGSIVKIKVGDTFNDFIIVHQGKPSSLYDDSCDGTWVLAKDIYTKSIFGSSSDYTISTPHTYLNGTFFGLLDASVQSVVKQAKIPYQNVSGTMLTGANGLDVKAFLLSGTELGTSNSNMYQIGTSLAYFSAGNSRIANFDGTAAIYWTRSPYRSGSVNQFCIAANGAINLYGISGTFGVRPAMILSYDALVDDDGDVMG